MSMTWASGWDVRVDAAQGRMHLASRFAAEHPEIVDGVAAILDDPVPAVRLQVARNLAALGRVAPERMWTMAHRIAARETSAEVLTHALVSLRAWSRSAPERCEVVLSKVLARLAEEFKDNDASRHDLYDVLGSWTAQLFAFQDRPRARGWIEGWAADPQHCAELAKPCLSELRAALFSCYQPEATAETLARFERTRQVFELFVQSAGAITAEAYLVLCCDTAPELKKLEAGEQHHAADSVMHHALHQFYFGSGAFPGRDEPGLRDVTAMGHFLIDYAGSLGTLATSRNPETLHELIGLYEFLIPGNPGAVFKALHAILCGRGQEEGYHFESLGIDIVVRIMKRYLADYRAIFEDEDHRTRLLAILGLFADVGWLEALQLLYQLPDLLR